MLSSFLIAVTAVLPFIVYLSFGAISRRVGWVTEDFLDKLNAVVFKCFFPFLMFWNLYHVDTGTPIRGRFLAVCVGSLALLILLLCLTVPRLVKAKDKCSVIIQAAYRSNFVLFGIPMAQSVFGDEGGAVAAMLVAIVVPIYNAFAVILFEYYRGGEIRPLTLLKNIVTNPLILGALVGLAFLLLGIKLPTGLEKPISEFSGLTTPIALFCLGGTLHFSAMKHNQKYLYPVLGLKLLVLPLLATLISSLAGFSNVERFVFLIMSGAPMAVSSYTMAANMGGDGELAGEYVVLSTVLSLATLFGFIFVYNMVGFIG
ncbi:MAG: AEC family transporter [Clostridia bacterium]|nr:AEC family transporter [Clostridia bacterium]